MALSTGRGWRTNAGSSFAICGIGAKDALGTQRGHKGHQARGHVQRELELMDRAMGSGRAEGSVQNIKLK